MIRRSLGVQKRYGCQWRCAHCGRDNRERGVISAFDRIRVNQFTDNIGDEVQLSGEIAQEKAEKRFRRLQERVNARQWLWGLQTPGVCRKCGKRQRWSPLWRQGSAGGMAVLSLLLVLCSGPAEKALPLGIAAAAVAALATECLILIWTRWMLQRGNPAHAPWVEAVHRET